jgi:hypothetical protein
MRDRWLELTPGPRPGEVQAGIPKKTTCREFSELSVKDLPSIWIRGKGARDDSPRMNGASGAAKGLAEVFFRGEPTAGIREGTV